MQLWKNNQPTDEGVNVYTEGDCWILSYYLAKRLGTRVALIGGRMWGHAVAEVPNSTKYLDVEGLHTKHSLIKNKAYTSRGNNSVLHVTVDHGFKQYIKDICFEYNPSVFGVSTFGASNITHRRMAQRLTNKHLGV